MSHRNGAIVCVIFSVLLFPLCLVGSPVVTRSPDCSPGAIRMCLKTKHDSVKRENVSLPTTREQMNRTCSAIGSPMECSENYARNCLPPAALQRYYRRTNGVREAFSEFCTPGKTQDAFLKYAPCFRNISHEKTLCGDQYKQMKRATEKYRIGEMSPGSFLPLGCCTLNEYRSCFLNSASYCGSDAEKGARPYLKFLSLSVEQNSCRTSTKEYTICPEVLQSFSEESGDDSTYVIHLLTKEPLGNRDVYTFG